MRLLRVLSICVLPAGLLPAMASAQPSTLPPVQVVHRFTPALSQPNAPLVQAPNGDFYGTTPSSLFRLTTAGVVTEVARFGNRVPVGGLALASDGALYGTTNQISNVEGGTIFRFDPATSELRTIHEFTGTEGSLPVGGLVQSGGSLYGVTRYGPGLQATGRVFHLVLSSGAVVIDASVSDTLGPASPLTVGPDGLLYGLAGTKLYRFDPSTGTVAVLRELSVQDGVGGIGLVLGADGALYGAAALGGLEEAGTIFRYTPASGLFQRLHTLAPANGFDGRKPGPLVAGGDGHYYGVTDFPNNGTSGAGTLYRLRSGGGGTFTYETLRTLDTATTGKPTQAALTLGTDGLLYGFAQEGGPSGSGTIFRFDPAAGGPPSNPLSFAVLHTFPRLTTWNPSAPVLGADGLLYGLTNAGGANGRGGLYRVNPANNTVTQLGEVPAANAVATRHAAFARGSDGLLYAPSVRGTLNPDFAPQAYDILRADPASGAVTVAAASLTASQGRPAELVRAATGELIGGQRYPDLPGFVRFDPPASTTLTTLWPTVAGVGVSAVTATSDGAVYTVLQVAIPHPLSSRFSTPRAFLARLTPSTGAVEQVLLGDELFGYVDRIVEGPGGVLYLAAVHLGAAKVLTVNPATGAMTPVCVLPGPPRIIEHVTLGPDGALYGFLRSWMAQRMFRCEPATGAVATAYLPPSVGQVVGPLATVGGVMYGATMGTNPNDGGALIRITPGGTLPALDSDGDGLSNVWETTYGLDPFRATVDDGAAGDPDGDGLTNAQELAAGTHPRGSVTRLFAEGATGPFFGTRFDITAPRNGPTGATIRARFLTDTGAVVATDLVVPAFGHLDLDPATLAGLEHASFSAVFESDEMIAINRTMTWGAGGYGSHVETGLAAASTSWYFAEGSTSGSFALFYLLQNPQSAPVTATVTYLRPSGLAPVVRTYTLPPNSRTTIVVDDDPAVGNTDVSAAITATAPIVAERAMYLNRPGQPFGAGHESAGVTAPALNWFLAEGATGTFFDLFVLIANPGTTDATVQVEYLRSSGGPLTKTYTIPAQSRVTIWVDDEQLPAGSGQKPLAAVNVSTVVRSTNAVPIIVERAMWWPGPETSADFWYEAHNSPGVTGTAQRWAIGGAEIGGPDGADSYVLIANTTDDAATVSVVLVGTEYASYASGIGIPPRSRVTVRLGGSAFASPSPPGRYGVVVQNFGTSQVPVVVELATYASPDGVMWARGANALATPIP